MIEYLTEHSSMVLSIVIIFFCVWSNERKIRHLSERIADLEDRLNSSEIMDDFEDSLY